MRRIKKWMNGTSGMFSMLAGERITRLEVLAAHVGCVAVLVGCMCNNVYILLCSLAVASACVFLNIVKSRQA